MIDLDKLEQVAQAATPGPWAQEYTNKCEPDDEGGSIFSEGIAIVSQSTRRTIVEVFDNPLSEEDFAHIAAFDPQTILKLIAVVRIAHAAQESGFIMPAGIAEALEALS